MFDRLICSRIMLAILLFLSFNTISFTQQNPDLAGSFTVPRLITFNGILKTANGLIQNGIVGVTFSLYKEQLGGAPLWTETQNVQVDEQGRYSILLGLTQPTGLPTELFLSGESRWLGIQVQRPGEEEQARVFLVSVPYALKAADADTIGGKPASAFVLAETDHESSNSRALPNSGGPTAFLNLPSVVNRVTKYIDTTGGQDNSSIQDGGSGVSVTISNSNTVGIGTATPSAILDIRNTASPNSTPLDIHQANGNPYAMRFFNDTFGGTAGATFFVTDTGEGNVGSGGPSKFNLLTNGAIRWSIGSTGHLIAGVDNSFDIGAIGAARPRNVYVGNNGLIAGNLGIGTNTPTAKAEVVGDLKVSGNGVISGNGSGLTSLSATHLVGTVPNSNTTSTASNSPSTIVLRDGSGNFSAGTVTAAAFSGNGAALTNVNAASLGGLAASSLSAARTRAITYLAGCDTCSPLADTDSQKTIFYNVVGAMTITAVTCFSDAGTPSINLQRDDGSPVNILNPNLSCSTAGTTTTNTFVPAEVVLNLNDKLDFVMVSAGGAKRLTVSITAIVN